MRTGILGGTFDPIHNAHLHAAETALHDAPLDRVLFLPAGDPWQKRDRDISAAQHRVEMTRLAIAGVDGFELDTREVEREGPTYTSDTLVSFPDDEDLYLILGGDSAAGIDTWHQADQVKARADILVVPRPGTDLVTVTEVLPEATFLEMAPMGISGTLIREMAREGRPFQFVVPAAVYDYILENNLYTDPGNRDMVRETNETESSS